MKQVFNCSKIYMERRTQGKTAKQMSEAIGISQNAISSIETGKSSPALETLIAIADFLGKPLEHFFESTTENNVKKENDMGTEIKKPLEELYEVLIQTTKDFSKELYTLSGQGFGDDVLSLCKAIRLIQEIM